MDLILQMGAGVSAMLLAWAAKTLLDATRILAVHDEKHRRHDERISQLEKGRHAAS